MPAAAVIPAPIAYIKVVAVKKLVVEFPKGPWRPSMDAAPPPLPLWRDPAGRKVAFGERHRLL